MLFSGSWLHPMSVPRGRAGKPNMTKMVRNAVIMTKIAMVMIWHRLRQETVAAPKVSTSLRIHTIARWVSSFERFQTMAGNMYVSDRSVCFPPEKFHPSQTRFSLQHFQVCMNGAQVQEEWCAPGSFFPHVRIFKWCNFIRSNCLKCKILKRKYFFIPTSCRAVKSVKLGTVQFVMEDQFAKRSRTDFNALASETESECKLDCNHCW